jgi:hypothetical protein
VAGLVDFLFDGVPERLANLPTSFELSLDRAPTPRTGVSWRIEDPEGVQRVVDDAMAEGQELTLGPGATAFSPAFNFARLAPLAGDHLIVDEADEPLVVEKIVPIVLRQHPNVGDTWHAIAPDGGDLVYNTACEVLFEGACPNRVEVSPDPNARLPRSP